MTMSGGSALASLFAAAEAVIFDVEGVALDAEPMWDAVHEELLRRRGVRYDRAAVKPLLTGRSAGDAVAVLAEACGLRDNPADLLRERHALMRDRLAGGVALILGFANWSRRSLGAGAVPVSPMAAWAAQPPPPRSWHACWCDGGFVD